VLTVLSFLLALTLLTAVHEWGHYRAACACGVKALRFSLGFGRVLLRWQPKGSPTEFVLCALPLGGYVRMLDEREAPVLASERHLTFNAQSLSKRVAIVLAGPLANLLLAVLLYAVVAWVGVQRPLPLLSKPEQGSLAERAGLQGGELVMRAGTERDRLQAVPSFDVLQTQVVAAALNGQDIYLETLAKDESTAAAHSNRGIYRLPTRELAGLEPNVVLLQRIGIVVPQAKPVVGELVAGGAAQLAGLQRGDVVRAVNAVVVVDAAHLRQIIRSSVQTQASTLPAAGSLVQPQAQVWQVERRGRWAEYIVTPQAVRDPNPQSTTKVYGRVGAHIGVPPAVTELRYGVVDGVAQGLTKTWDLAAMSVQMIGKMLIGQASLKNLSGPVTMAEYAGQSAGQGVLAYVLFLAAISVSLGVFNLLPVPMLDGGHLMYYLYEAVRGQAPSALWQEWLQRAGSGLLILLMMLAFYNDLIRLL
jgi:regulator of sigma E protease